MKLPALMIGLCVFLVACAQSTLLPTKETSLPIPSSTPTLETFSTPTPESTKRIPLPTKTLNEKGYKLKHEPTYIFPTLIPTLTPTIEPTIDWVKLHQEEDAAYSDTVVYTNTSYGMSFEYPSFFTGTGCEPKEHSDRLSIGPRINIWIYPSEGMKLEDYVKEHYNDILFGRVSSSKNIIVAREPALYMEIWEDGFSFAHVLKHVERIFVFLLTGRLGCDSEWWEATDGRLYALIINTIQFLDEP